MNNSKRNKIQPSRFLGDKVPNTGGPSPEQAITQALSLGNELIESYQGWAIDDLQKLWEEYKSVTPMDEQPEILIRNLYDMSHEVRGHGGTFGFPLISLFADSLCKYLDSQNSLNQRVLDIIKLHILAMKAIFRQDLKGDQLELTDNMGELLQTLRSR